MNYRFAIIIQKHRLLGWVLAPFDTVCEKDKDFYTPVEYLLPDNNKKYSETYYKKIISLIAKFDDKEIFRKFSTKKKDSQKDFFDKISEEVLNNNIRPFIEKHIFECYKIIVEHNIPVYLRHDESNLHPEDEIKIDLNQTKVIFNFNKTETGLEYGLDVKKDNTIISLLQKPFVLLSNAPSLIIIENCLYHFETIDGKKLLPFFNKNLIIIPQKFEQQYFDTFVLNAIKNNEVTNKGFEIVDIYEKPKISATIIRDVHNIAGINFELTYRKWKFHGFDHEQKFAVEYSSINSAPKYLRIHRDFEYEQLAQNRLLEEGLEPLQSIWRLKLYYSDGYYDTLHWIRDHKKVIEEFGIEVFDESEIKIESLEAKIEITVSSDSIDWFDVYAVVSFGEYKIPFKRLRKNILQENPIVQLPNNQIGVIPYEWFAKYRELFLFSSKTDDDTFSLKTIHYKTVQRLPVDFNDAIKTRFLHIDTNGIKNTEVPEQINATLREYQIEGFRWLSFLDANNFGGCLADDMGLGKTLQTITLLQHIINNQKLLGTKTTSLVVAPTSIVHNWYNEFKKFAPDIKVFKYSGNDRIKDLRYFKKYNIIITTYGLLRNDISSFEEYNFYYTILDESQMIKNPDSKIYGAVLRLQSERKLILTGTPIENSLVDLWAQMNFVNRDMLGSLSFFKEHFVKGASNEVVENQLKRIVNPFIFRREKQEVAKDLPALTEQIRICAMEDEQSKIYETEKSKVRNMILSSIENDTFQKSTINVLQALMRLRQIANHPTLIEEAGNSGKFLEVIRILDNLVHNHKVLIFSSFVKHLDIFKEYFKKKEIKYAYLTGSTKDRENVIKTFQENDDCKIFLISIKAGGVGLNLTKADYIFILDPWWNPAVESQAISRAHRIGQKNNVNVYRFISQGTIEEKIQRLQQKKSELARNYVYDNTSIPFSQEEVSYLIE